MPSYERVDERVDERIKTKLYKNILQKAFVVSKAKEDGDVC